MKVEPNLFDFPDSLDICTPQEITLYVVYVCDAVFHNLCEDGFDTEKESNRLHKAESIP